MAATATRGPLVTIGALNTPRKSHLLAPASQAAALRGLAFDHGASAIALQEVARGLRGELGERALSANPNSVLKDGNTIGNSVLLGGGSTVLDRGEIALPWGARTLHLPVVLLRTPEGATVTVVSVHLPTRRSISERGWRRMVRAIRKWTDAVEGAVALAGDWNRDQKTVSRALGRRWSCAGQHGIDGIWVRDAKPHRARVITKGIKGRISDHPAAVMATIRLTSKSHATRLPGGKRKRAGDHRSRTITHTTHPAPTSVRTAPTPKPRAPAPVPTANPTRKEGTMSYREAESLKTLKAEIDRAAPRRSIRSDGWIGDAAHASRDSDHNPWIKDRNGVGVVRARDFTHDPNGGLDCHRLAQRLADLLRRGHPALGPGAYIIWDCRIISRNRIGEGWRPYDGSNPHTAHLHVSVGESGYDSRAVWGVLGGASPTKPEPKPEPPKPKLPRVAAVLEAARVYDRARGDLIAALVAAADDTPLAIVQKACLAWAALLDRNRARDRRANRGPRKTLRTLLAKANPKEKAA